jgi:YD repeat-containing protein
MDPGSEWWLLRSVEDLQGDAVEVERDGRNRIVRLRQSRERRALRFHYSTGGHVESVSLVANAGPRQSGGGDDGGRVILQYAYRGHCLVECRDAARNRILYEYDQHCRMVRHVSRGGMVYFFRYDRAGRCVESSGQDGFGAERLTYCDDGKFTRVENAQGHVTTYHWNDAGQVMHVTSPLGASTSYHYDEHGRIGKIILPGNRVTAFEYDDFGTVKKVTHPDGGAQTFLFDDRHQLLRFTDQEGHSWTREYASPGRLSAVGNDLGEWYRFDYSAEGDLVRITDPRGHRRTFSWDERGDLRSVSDWEGNCTRYGYDEEGMLTEAVTPHGDRTTAVRDQLGRIASLTFPDGTSRRYGWNAADQITDFVDEKDQGTKFRYSRCGLLSECVKADGRRTRYLWGMIPGQLVGIENENGERHSLEYDEDGRVIRQVDFSGCAVDYQYGEDSFLAAAVAGESAVRFRRDPVGRVVDVEYADGSVVRYEFDLRGLLRKTATPDHVIERDYDALGRLIRELQGAHEVRYTYDSLGNRASCRTSLGTALTYRWGPNRQVQSILGSNLGHELLFEFDPLQRETARSLGSQVRLSQSYDARGRLAEQRVTGGSQRSWAVGGNHPISRQYSYDPCGNVTRISDHTGVERHSYDRTHRPVEFDHSSSGRRERYDYDDADNLTRIERYGKSTPVDFTTAAGNRVVQRGDVGYDYDANGFRTARRSREGTTEYNWNARPT